MLLKLSGVQGLFCCVGKPIQNAQSERIHSGGACVKGQLVFFFAA
jgi:hypothetical protein